MTFLVVEPFAPARIRVQIARVWAAARRLCMQANRSWAQQKANRRRISEVDGQSLEDVGPRSRRRHLIPVAAIGLVTLLAFLPALDAQFVTWDDNRNFTGNPAYRGLGATHLKWMWTTTLMGHYIPLTWMTLGADYLLWGMDGRGYHLTNLLLHCFAAILLYFAALRLFSAGRSGPTGLDLRPAAAAAALCFAVHPLRVESVAWITERRDMLSLVFLLACLLAYLKFTQETAARMRWYFAALTLFVAGLLSKATIVTFPMVLVIVNVYPLRRLSADSLWSRQARAVYAELLPFFLMSGAAGLLSLLVLNPPAQLGFSEKIAVTAYSLRFYAQKIVLPAGLAPLYEMPRPVSAWAPMFVASYVFCAAALAALLLGLRRSPAVTAIVIASAAIMFPLLGLVQNGPQIAADRYTYHAAAAFSLILGLALLRWPRPVAYFSTAVGIAILSVLTWRQTTFWKDSERLWSRVLAVDSSSSIAQVAMGEIRLGQRRTSEALQHFERGVRLDPNYAEGHNNLGVLLGAQGLTEEAMAHYERAAALRPDYADAWLNWGVALSASGRLDAAVEKLNRALTLRPDVANGHAALGNAMLRSGRQQEAMAHYAEELRLHPSNAEAHLNWGVALAQQQQYAGAIDHFESALRLQPQLREAAEFRAMAQRRLRGQIR